MKIHSYLLAMVCALSALLQGCGNTDTPLPDTPDAPDINLSIACVSKGAISRADAPQYEEGTANERAISKALVIIYDKPLNSSESGGRVKLILNLDLSSVAPKNDIDQINIGYYATSSSVNYTPIATDNARVERYYEIGGRRDIADALMSTGDSYLYAMALANIDIADITPALTVGTTVAQLRSMVYTGALCTGPKTTTGAAVNSVASSTNFAMTAINEVRFSTTPVDDNIVIPMLMVQRLAARIDVAFGDQGTTLMNDEGKNLDEDGNLCEVSGKDPVYLTVNDYDATNEQYYDLVENDGGYIFPLYDETTGERIAGGEIRITGIELLNCTEQKTYLFEHSINGTPAYIGNEQWSNGYATKHIDSPSDRTIADRVLAQTTGVSPVTVINNALISKYGDYAFHKGDKFSFYSILGYVGENTYQTYSADNKYTSIKFKGNVTICNDPLSATSTSEDHTEMEATIKVRHSFGTVDTSKPLCYGIVRNTIYRIYIKFYASGSTVMVRYYYYLDKNAASQFVDYPYGTEVFNKYVVEGSGPHDD